MAGLLNELLNYIDGAKRTARNNFAMWLEDPQQAALNTAEGLQGQIDAFKVDPVGRVGDMLPGGAAFGGIIRKGGMPELVTVHQAPLDRYALWAQTQGKLPQEMYSPSVAINKGAISQDFGSETGGTIHFVGRPDALDPARINARLYNRDAYTPRDPGGYYTGGRSELLGQNIGTIPPTMDPRQFKRNFAGDRLADRELIPNEESLPRNLRFLESPTADLIAYEHKTAVTSSPSFRSFKEFEQNPRGAALLGESSVAPNAEALRANRALEGTMFNLERAGNPAAKAFLEKQAQYFDEPTGLGLASNLGDWKKQPGAKDVEKALREYRKALAYLPSQYAELKVSGPLQIRGNNFSGAVIVPPRKPAVSYQPESINAVADLLRQRGIPTIINDPITPLTPQDLGWLARAYSEGVLK